jgi:hypothetical protein
MPMGSVRFPSFGIPMILDLWSNRRDKSKIIDLELAAPARARMRWRMAVPIPRPRHVVSVVRRGFQAIEWTIMLMPRIVVLIDEIEIIAARVSTVLNQIELTERRISSVVAGIEQTQERVVAVVTRVSETVAAIDVIVGEAALLTRRVTPLLDAYQQPLEQLQPIVARLSETTSPAEVDAMVALLDTLPDVAHKLDRDVLPILDTLGTVAPDLRDLLDVSKQLNVMLGAIPGLGRIKKQIDERQEQDDAYRADEEPPSAPDRSG